VDRHRIALVTGSSRDIGRRIVLRLAAEGVDVVVNSARSVGEGEAVAEEARALGVRAVYCQADVSDFDQVASMYRMAARELGAVNVLVNCASWAKLLAFEFNDQEYWHKIVNTKFYGYVHNVFHALPGMREAGWGKIVNLTGESGRIGISVGAVYSGVQGAIITMTKSWAREFAPFGIRVNAVSPGPTTDTSGLDEHEASAPAIWTPGGEMSSVLGRAAPEDVAATVAFFARQESDKITGQTLSVSGGRSFAS
jgi:NAD(P)-dependent dehydrogenase (short-subunit alcohol dehydrogenase family)